jgi:hypothetical protein
VPESRRDEQKLWLILFQIRSVRSRLNLLATQQWLFTTLALMIGGAALILIAAAKLGPFGFLGVSTAVLLVAASGIFATARRGWAARVDLASAAGLADRRADLKGRLTTVLALSESAKQAQLWPFLVEDTYAMRDDFEPRRIEPRLVSRSLGALLAALLLAVLALPNLNRGGAAARQIAAGAGAGGQVTADLSQLQIQPADPALQPNAQIYADPETLRRLQQKLAAEGSPHQRKGLGGLMDRARRFADAFQHQLTGRNSESSAPLNLRLTDRNPDHTPGGHNGGGQPQQMAKNSANASAHRGAAGAAANGRRANRLGAPPPAAIPGSQADQMAKDSAGATSQPNQSSNSNQAGANDNANPPEQDAANDFGGGANHGIGADPEHLFGPPSPQPFGSDSFKIAIDAEPSDEASAPGSPAYLPPKVRVPLNPNQLPDEPIARAAVPASEQTIIKRVFDR